MDLEDIKIKYEAELADFNEDKVLLININFLYKKGMSYNEIYEATRRSRPISTKNANKAKYICSVYK